MEDEIIHVNNDLAESLVEELADLVAEPQPQDEPKAMGPQLPPIQLAAALFNDGFKIAFVPRIPAGETKEVPIIAQIVFTDVGLAIQELESALQSARQAERNVIYEQGVKAGQAWAQSKATEA